MSFGLVKSAAAGAAASLRLRYTSGHDVAIANWKNRTLFTGDNLDVLRGMNSESVDLIYLDPPFNSIGGERLPNLYHRTDIPQRTDVGKLPPYKTHRHRRHRPSRQPPAAVRSLQLDQGNDRPGRFRRQAESAGNPGVKTGVTA